jgi:hypothetical protein
MRRRFSAVLQAQAFLRTHFTHKRNFSTKFIVKFCFLCALGAKKYDFELGAIGNLFSNLAWYCTLSMY